jgi:hypothetical protein
LTILNKYGIIKKKTFFTERPALKGNYELINEFTFGMKNFAYGDPTGIMTVGGNKNRETR